MSSFSKKRKLNEDKLFDRNVMLFAQLMVKF